MRTVTPGNGCAGSSDVGFEVPTHATGQDDLH